MNDERWSFNVKHPRRNAKSLAEVLDRVEAEFRAAGIHPYRVMVPGEAPGEYHVAMCVDAYAAAACVWGVWAAEGKIPPLDTKA